MGKKPVVIRRRPDGSLELILEGFSDKIQIWANTPEEKFEAVREQILKKGLVFTEKIEKLVRKELNF
jgi:hypothetical protein